MKVNYKFRNDVFAKVPVECLIEEVQILRASLESYLHSGKTEQDVTNLIEDVHTVIDCLEEDIDRYTEVPNDLKVVPSGSTLIAMGIKSGIIVQEDGSDILCAAGKPISETMSGGCCQCGSCEHYSKCFADYGLPRYGRILPMDMIHQLDGSVDKSPFTIDDLIVKHLDREDV